MKLRAFVLQEQSQVQQFSTASAPSSKAEAPDVVSTGIAVSTATTVAHPTAVTALIFVLALFFLCFISVYARSLLAGLGNSSRRRQRSATTSSNTPRRRLFGACHGLDRSVVSSLPVLHYVGGNKEESCVVCLAEFEAKEAVKLIPGCGHVFHPECIDAWLLSRGSCPVCRCTKVLGSGSSSSSSSLEHRTGLQFGFEERKDVDHVVGLERRSSCSLNLGDEVKVEVLLPRSCSL